MKIPASKPASDPCKRVVLFRVFAVLFALIFAAGLCEAALRIFMSKQLAIPLDERNLLFRHDPRLGWFPVPNFHIRFKGSQWIRIADNSQGFRAPEQRQDSRPG